MFDVAKKSRRKLFAVFGLRGPSAGPGAVKKRPRTKKRPRGEGRDIQGPRIENPSRVSEVLGHFGMFGVFGHPGALSSPRLDSPRNFAPDASQERGGPYVLPHSGLKWLRLRSSDETEWSNRGVQQPGDSKSFDFGYSRFACAATAPKVRCKDGREDREGRDTEREKGREPVSE